MPEVIPAYAIDTGPVQSDDVVVSFASPLTQWVVTHNMNEPAVSFVCFDISGNQIIGDPEYLNNNELVIHWYYPTAGEIRVSH